MINNIITSKDIIIENIDGIFHCFQCYEKYFILNSESLLLCETSKSEYIQILEAKNPEQLINCLGDLAAEHSCIKEKKQVDILPSLTLVLTHSCNLDCEYCFDRTSNNEDLDFCHAVKSIKKFLKTSKRFQVVFFGGEPLLKFELIKKIVVYCEELKANNAVEYIIYSITTNGKLLDDEIIQYLNKYNFNVTVSIDGFSVENDSYIGSQHKTLSDDDLYRYKKIEKLNIRTTVSSKNIRYMYSMYNKFSLMEPNCISFMPVASDFEYYTKSDILLWKRQLELIIYHNKKERRNIAIDDIYSFVNIVRNNIKPSQCQPTKSVIAIDSNGVEYPCHRFIGKNVTKTDYLKLGKSKNDYSDKCSECWAHGICPGTCKYNEMIYVNCQIVNCELIKKRIEIAMYFI